MSANILPLRIPSLKGIPILKKTEKVIKTFDKIFIGITGKKDIRHLKYNNWGIFDADTGKEFCTFNNFVNLSFAHGSSIATAPLEGDKLKSYNKTKSPYTLIVSITRTGSNLLRQLFLTSLEEALNNTKNIRIITPEITYPLTQVIRIAYKRDASQGKLLTLELSLQEIRLVDDKQADNTKKDSGKVIKDHGQVQPNPPTPNSAIESLPNKLQDALSKFGGLPL